jgi:hypothetical protein
LAASFFENGVIVGGCPFLETKTFQEESMNDIKCVLLEKASSLFVKKTMKKRG